MDTYASNNSNDNKAKLDYLKELLADRSVLSNYPGIYIHVGKILEQEIVKVRSALFATYGIYSITEKDLPAPEGPKVNLVNKVYMPPAENNSFNFVGRILGPDGSTAKCLQKCLGVKLMVRGRGSMRDRKKEEANIGKPNWEHLNDKLHVVLTVEDYENRAQARLDKASEYIALFLKESVKSSDRDDKVKQMQLMELSFRREPRVTWPVNYGELVNFNMPPRNGAFFPNPNLMGFGYGYPHPGAPPPTPHPNALFSPLHSSPSHSHPHHSHHHQHHPHSQHATSSVPGSVHPAPPGTAPPAQFGPVSGNHHQPGLTVTQAHGTQLGSLTHSFASALSPGINATVLMGHPGAAGPYATSHLAQTANNSGNGGLIGPGQSVTAGPAPNPNIPPGALAMASMNYWSNAASGLTHLPRTDYPLSAGPSSLNGYPNGTEQTSSDGFTTAQLTNGSPSSGLCNIFMPAHSATPALGRVHEEPVTGGLLGDFVPCIGTKDPGVVVTDGTMAGGLPGLYASTGPGPSTSTKSNTLKLTGGTLHTGSTSQQTDTVSRTSTTASPATPSSSFAAKQGLKPRYFQRGNIYSSHNSHGHSISNSTGSRGNRNTVVAVKVGSKDKSNAGLTNGTRQTALKVHVSTNSRLDENNTSNTDKKYATGSRSTVKKSREGKEIESDWQDVDTEPIAEDGRSKPETPPLEDRMLKLSLISGNNGQSSSDLETLPIGLENAK